jgi:hypothetical protein
MAVQTEVWLRYIMQRLWKDNSFLKFAYNDDQYVVGGKIVHIPQPGSKPTIVKNRSSFPATTVQRTDTDITYTLDKYTSDPTHIEKADMEEITYDKISSVFGDHAGELVETVGDDMIIKWLASIPAGSIVRTSGADAAVTSTGQTGERRVMVHGDLKKAKLVLDLQNVPANERYALLEANMADQLFSSLSDSQYRDFSQYADAKEGVIGRLYGFNIMNRSKVAIATSALAIEALGASVDATDHVASMCWQKDAVTRAIGEKKFFERKDDPEYYGDIYSALLRAGGRRRRTDSEGVVAIIQMTAVD